jgi:hypothetical protein
VLSPRAGGTALARALLAADAIDLVTGPTPTCSPAQQHAALAGSSETTPANDGAPSAAAIAWA